MASEASFILGIAEKKSAAIKIAKALAATTNTKPSVKKYKGIEYYVVNSSRGRIVIAPASGHLYTLIQNGKGWQYPVYDFSWIPLSEDTSFKDSRYKKRLSAHVSLFNSLIPKAQEIILMTDYDQEGEVIGGIILEMQGKKKQLNQVKRLKLSTLTKDEIIQAFQNLEPSMNFGLYNRGLARHYLDWLYGINLSRTLILSLKRYSGQYVPLSTGRVQGPTLKFIYDREIEINAFVSLPYWKIVPTVTIEGMSLPLELLHYTKISTQKTAKFIVELIKQSTPILTSVTTKSFDVPPPTPLNLSKLQALAYKRYKIPPSKTLEYAESLYLKALISYPRTDSEAYPDTLDHQAVLTKLLARTAYKAYKTKLLPIRQNRPTKGKKKDPAHPAIYPTGEKPTSLSAYEQKIYDLIVRRYFATFGENAKKNKTTLEIEFSLPTTLVAKTEGVTLPLRGKYTIEHVTQPGWMIFESSTTEKKAPHAFKENALVTLKSVSLTENFEKPRARYNQASLLKEMEKHELGTKATRADIIKTIIERKYVDGDQLTLTSLGFSVIEILEAFAPEVIQPSLTRSFEQQMELIEQGKESLDNVLLKGIFTLHEILMYLQPYEEYIGKKLSADLKDTREQQQKQKVFFKCPVCKTGDLILITNKTTRKRFLGCTNYSNPEIRCSATFPLPQKGSLKPLKEKCKYDGYPQVQVRLRGKNTYIYCINPNCVSRESWGSNTRKKQQKEKDDK